MKLDKFEPYGIVLSGEDRQLSGRDYDDSYDSSDYYDEMYHLDRKDDIEDGLMEALNDLNNMWNID